MWSVTVEVPATIANLGPGFDTLGLATDLALNRLTLTGPRREPVVTVTGEGAGRLPAGPDNLAYRAAAAGFEAAGEGPAAFGLHCDNGIPPARGLGSSAAAVVGGLAAADAWLRARGREGLDLRRQLALAAGLEGHPDNVAAALLGGVTVACPRTDAAASDPVLAVRLDPLPGLRVVACVPDRPLSTRRARRALPRRVPFAAAAHNVARTALLVAAVCQGRPDLLAEATRDLLHQPYRSRLLPWLDAVLDAARLAGAWGACLAGAGPSVLAFAGRDSEAGVAAAMEGALAGAGVAGRTLTGRISTAGARVVGS